MAIYRGPGGTGDSATGEDVFGPNSSITNLTGITGEVKSPTLIEFASGDLTPTARQLTWDSSADKLGIGLASGVASVLTSSDISVEVQPYDSNLESFVNAFTLPTTDAASGFLLATNGTGTLSLVSPSGVADGDRGDITVSGAGSIWSIDSGVIDTTKLGGDITVAGKALLDDASATDQRATLGLVIGTNVQSYNANLDEYAAVNPTAAGLALLDDVDNTAQRTTLGLGTIATQDASSVSISGGSITGITDLAIADGGTGASDAATAFTNLKQNATDTATGVVELATNAEAAAGTDTTRAITPSTLFGGLNATGTAPIYACRAWVNFNGTGTVAIRGSGNVSSITDNNTGDYTVNFTTAMPDANYSISVSSDNLTNAAVISFVRSATAVPTVSAVRVGALNASLVAADSPYYTVAIFR
jgi:hypothetical protein